MKSYHHFCDIAPTLFDIVSTLFLSPHPLYWWYHTNSIYGNSSSIYAEVISIELCTATYSLLLYHQRHCTCVSHPHFPWYHNICVYDIVPILCLTLDTLYKVPHPQYMTSHHIIYDITGTAFMSSVPWYLTLHPQYLSPHNHSKYDLWTTVCMTSHPLYIWHLMHHT